MMRKKSRKKIALNICIYKKKPYLCIAFETEVYGRLAQLVQSICLTSRGSAVRIRQRPPKNEALHTMMQGFFVSVSFPS